MCKVIKVKKLGSRLQHLVCFHDFFLDIIILLLFVSFIKLNPKSQSTMDEQRQTNIIHKQAHKLTKKREK
jgi:hypothetical protein